MILLLTRISPHSMVYASTPTNNFGRRLTLPEPELKVVTKLPKEVESVQEQFSELLISSNNIGKNITLLLNKSLAGNTCISQTLAFTPSTRSNNGWLSINVIRQSYKNPNYYRGFGDQDLSLYKPREEGSIEVKFESCEHLRELTKDELKKYSFALYLYRKSGNDSMQERKHFKAGNHSYSIDLDPSDVNETPSAAFQETVRHNFIDEEHTPDHTYFLLAFREDQISDKHEDLLLIYPS